jgi:hypothetical protein
VSEARVNSTVVQLLNKALIEAMQGYLGMKNVQQKEIKKTLMFSNVLLTCITTSMELQAGHIKR